MRSDKRVFKDMIIVVLMWMVVVGIVLLFVCNKRADALRKDMTGAVEQFDECRHCRDELTACGSRGVVWNDDFCPPSVPARPEWVERQLNQYKVKGWGYVSFTYPHGVVGEKYGLGAPRQIEVLLPWVVFLDDYGRYWLDFCDSEVMTFRRGLPEMDNLSMRDSILGPYNLTNYILATVEYVETFNVQEWWPDALL